MCVIYKKFLFVSVVQSFEREKPHVCWLHAVTVSNRHRSCPVVTVAILLFPCAFFLITGGVSRPHKVIWNIVGGRSAPPIGDTHRKGREIY